MSDGFAPIDKPVLMTRKRLDHSTWSATFVAVKQ
jgi:hypothetical protein